VTVNYKLTGADIIEFREFCRRGKKAGLMDKLLGKLVEIKPETVANCQTTLTDDAIKSKDFNGTHTYKYAAVKRIVGVNRCCYVFVGKDKAVIIPRVTFETDREFFAFFATIMKETGLQIELG
jgi:hypothetical protein